MFLALSFCILCPILQRFAPFARFETVQKPCRNRALTPGQTKNHFIRQRLDGIGSRDRTPKIKSWRMFNGGATAKGALIITPEKVIVTTPGADNKKEL